MMGLFKLYSFLYRLRIPFFPQLFYAMNRILFSVVLPPSVKIGQQVTFAYQGLATVIHARVSIGSRVCIGPQVVIGGRSGHKEVPIIEDDVFIGVGAKILGPVRIGRGSIIGANAVVIHDVPEYSVVAGIPAKVVKKITQNDHLSALISM